MVRLDRICAGIDRHRLQRLLVDAVNHYSPSYAEEPATQVFARAIEDAGLAYQRQPVAGGADTGGATRANLLVQLGPEPIGLLWVGHVDTIAAFDEEHAYARFDDHDRDLLYGLGTADMKGGCAAAVEALLAVAASGVEPRQGLCLALVVGEEEYGDGAEVLADAVQAPLVVVGEPTGLKPCLDHFGYLEMDLTCRGARAHAALPEVGSSAIHAMLVWMVRILEERRELVVSNGLAFNPRAIHGGGDLFTVAEECTAALDVHLAPQVEVELVRKVIEAAR
jgi:acetylornithine deacetylase